MAFYSFVVCIRIICRQYISKGEINCLLVWKNGKMETIISFNCGLVEIKWLLTVVIKHCLEQNIILKFPSILSKKCQFYAAGICVLHY